MSNHQDDQHDDVGWHRRLERSEQDEEISGSPGSHSNSSSSATRQARIVELLHSEGQPRNAGQNGNLDWVIGDEFYVEDVADNSDNLSGDDDGDSDDENMARVHEDYVDDEIVDHADDFIEIEAYFDEDLPRDTDEEEDDDGVENYDTLLPANHPYLGNDLQESRGRLVLAENSKTTLELINFRHIVLIPGQTLPITTTNLNPIIYYCLLDCVKTGKTTIGLMSEPALNPIGTTAEIRNYSYFENGEFLELRLILEGRQRFKLLSEPFEIAKKGEIEILPEVTLGLPYPRISSLLRYNTMIDTPPKFIISKHPYWLLKSYEARNVMRRILCEIKDWCGADLTKDPNDFSYWVAANLPISNAERMQALTFTCAEARLLWLLEVLKKSAHFACSTCQGVLCQKSDVFSMSRSGPQSSFVNPSGFIHDTITVRKAAGLVKTSNWSSQFTWFPGYQWRMAHCARCHRHIGWCYKSTEAETKPRRFFGLSRVNVSLQ